MKNIIILIIILLSLSIYIKADTIPMHVRITSITMNSEVLIDSNIENNYFIRLKHDNKSLTFHFKNVTDSPNAYQWKLKGLEEEWSEVTNQSSVIYPKLSPGEYVFMVKLYEDSDITNVRITISPPFWRSKFMIVLTSIVIAVIILLFLIIIRNKEKKRKISLKQQLLDKTKDIYASNQEVLNAYDTIEGQYGVIKNQNELITAQKKEIEDGIKSALTVHTGVLHWNVSAFKMLKDYFIFYKPRDIVSGDFYLSQQISGNEVIIIAADSTGHGVAGAFMSLLGQSILNHTFDSGIYKPSAILKHLDEQISDIFKSTGAGNGMDIVVCKLNLETNILEFSGANNPLWIVRKDNSFEEIKGVKKGINDAQERSSREWVNHEVKLFKGDRFFIFSDGYQDQFGGPKGRKFTVGKFKKFLIETSSLPIQSQCETVKGHFKEWKGEREQVDDIIIIGIEI